MLRLIESTKRALDSGLFYSNAVKAFVRADMDVSAEVAERNKSKVQGGDFGYETYYARQYLDARAAERKLADAERELNLIQGMQLGTLIFNDYKMNTKCMVESIEGSTVKVVGKRGAYKVTLTTNALGIQWAIKRAEEKGKRKAVA
jgi:hypothetical protein